MTDQRLRDEIQAILWQVKATASGSLVSCSADRIAEQTGRSMADVSAALSELERAGAIRRQASGEYAV
jgi:predicted Rossmann fold nucleotide-binding protein DprA/Smf involved in DNA uptake